MICQRIAPSIEISHFVKEYVLLHAVFEPHAVIPPKSYPVNPEEGITFVVRGDLHAETPELGIIHRRPTVSVFGPSIKKQNLFISQEYLMFHVRFQPGALHKLLRIPMDEMVHQYIDAEIMFGTEINMVKEELANTADYALMAPIVDRYIKKRIHAARIEFRPIDKIGEKILNDPQSFNLEKTASEACLSFSQFEKRFVRQFGVTPKYFSRICRFNQAYFMKEYNSSMDWLSIAVQTGYSDYQHLVKDFKQFAGVTPNILINESRNNPERVLNIARNFRGT